MPSKTVAKKTAPTTEPPTSEPVTVDKKVRTKKTTKSTVEKVTPVVETAPVVETTTTTEETNVVLTPTDTTLTDNFSDFMNKFQALYSQFSNLKLELKNLEKKTLRQLKVVEKIANKKKAKGSRAPSGFVKPAPISEELAIFLGKPVGTEMARTDVTREINGYIRSHSLQDKENGRRIIPDKPLCELLKITTDIQLTYFNLQRYMGPHFPKQIKPVVAEVSATV
jgi:chromatin remodeling complex protein RSC6